MRKVRATMLVAIVEPSTDGWRRARSGTGPMLVRLAHARSAGGPILWRNGWSRFGGGSVIVRVGSRTISKRSHSVAGRLVHV